MGINHLNKSKPRKGLTQLSISFHFHTFTLSQVRINHHNKSKPRKGLTQLSIRGSAAGGRFEQVCQEEQVDKAEEEVEEEVDKAAPTEGEERGEGER